MTVTAVAAIGLSIACGARERDREARVCVDGAQRVVSAELCHQSHHHGGVVPYFWYYHAAYARGGYPAVGTTVRAGGTTAPPGQAAPTARGGFGSTGSSRAVSA
ncbi:MAG: hypothetical protein ACRENP_23360 [Longimicrobiales bacterium]